MLQFTSGLQIIPINHLFIQVFDLLNKHFIFITRFLIYSNIFFFILAIDITPNLALTNQCGY